MKNLKTIIERNAVKYMRYKDQLPTISPEEIKLYRDETEKAFIRIPVKVCFVDRDPYANVEEMTRDIEDNKRLLVSSLNNNSEILPGYLNLMFRATHDFLHYFLQKPFDFEGEYSVYKAQKQLYSTHVGQRIIRSEIVLQTAYKTHFGSFAPTQKVIL